MYKRQAVQLRTADQPISAEEQREEGKVFLPYINGVTDKIGNLLQIHGVKIVFRPTWIIQQHLKSAKDVREPLPLGGVYSILCLCRQV